MDSFRFLYKRLQTHNLFIYLFSLIFLFLSSSIFSQVIEDWVAIYNGTGNNEDCVNAMAIDNSGNVYVTGYSIGSGTYNDYATVKYNSSGIEQWVARYNGPGNQTDSARALVIDSSGNVYVTGVSQSSEIGPYNSDYATIKYNNAGVEEWVARYNGLTNENDIANAIVIDNLGNVYVTGQSGASDSSPQGADYVTIEYNNSGEEQWIARYNGPGNDYDYSIAIAVDSSGNVYVTGDSEGSGTSFDYATIKYDNAGVEQWVSRYNGPGNGGDMAYAMSLDSSGNVYVTGHSWGSGTYGDYATVKYNSSGVEQWVARYNSLYNNSDGANAIAIDSSGNVYITGYSEDSEASPYTTDCVTIKYNNSGEEQWVARYNGPGNYEDYAHDIAIDSSGNIYITGSSAASVTSPHNQDYTTIKYNSSGVEEWITRYDDLWNFNDSAYAIALDSSGNVYITGQSSSQSTGHNYTTVKYSQNTIRVVTPNGGDIWQTGSTHDINWLSGCYVDSSLRITLYKQNVYLTSITSDTENDGSYSWYIPTNLEVGSDYKVRITSNSDSSIYDYSDNNFTITKWITVTSPNGDEIWAKGSNQTITWTSESEVGSDIRITLYKNGVYQFPITTSTLNDGSYIWIVPGYIIPGNDYKVRVTSNSDSSMNDFSDKSFSIISSVTITSPNGGENLTIGTTNNITWTASVNLGPSLRITLYKGGVYYSTITNDAVGNGSYSWTIPPNVEPGDDYKIRITSNSNGTYYDLSDNNFTIARGITVISPNGGENWQLGAIWSVLWTSSDDVGSSVRITLYKGGVYQTTITGNTPNDGLYTWNIPTYLEAGNDYKIRITSNTNGAFFNFSDNNFTITTGITVTSPNGRENWKLGSTHNINWTSLGDLGPSLRITLYKEGAYYLTITGDTPDDGSYSWTIPSTLATGTDYKVRITSNSNEAYCDFSDNNFTIFIFE